MIFYNIKYLGVEKDSQNKQHFTIQEKKGKQLTLSQKEWNTIQRFIRIKVEYLISKIEKFRINAETFRNRLYRYDMLFLTSLRITSTATVLILVKKIKDFGFFDSCLYDNIK